MGIGTSNKDKFESLLEKFLSDTLGSQGKKELLEIIINNPEFAKEYQKLAKLKSILESQSDPLSQEFPQEKKTGIVLSFPKSYGYLSAAALVLLSFGGYYLYWNSTETENESQKLEFAKGYSAQDNLSWKDLSPENAEGLKKIENSIKESKNSKQNGKLDETLIKSLKPHVDSLPKDPFLISPKELKNSLKKILPDEKADIERKFASMVRFPLKDLKEREKLMELVKKIDKTSATDLLKEKTQPEVRKVLYLKEGAIEKGFVYQEDGFYVVLKPDGNLILPIDSVEKIETE
ncbi:hypothetical protein CH373_01015 [Leptospira perolatii]|uniref:Uncharacterized protein n=1 Tax=Leptospira perolatii TaxID=2023191 RepID=A0A2M9ZRW0_9LEPT|nr:hypothetical protein [Leptospira perolatii]PJZ71131.1 hypothetical protein CH360_01015 [Leptospira perolatii]PJZ74663.1 hypothetical protein CH373_01015 [Leptospira perolatii]